MFIGVLRGYLCSIPESPDQDYPGIEDQKVLALACEQQRVLITADKDFGDLIFREHNDHCGVVLLRLENETSRNIIRVLNNALNMQNMDSCLEGRFVVVTEKRVRFNR